MQAKTIILFMKFFSIYCLSCNEVLELPSDERLSLSSLQTMPPGEIVLCVAHLGKEELPAEDAKFIWQSIIKFHSGIKNIPDSVLMALNWITVAVSPEDYANITLNNIDVIENFGLDYNLNDAQISAIANRVREGFSGKEPEDYTHHDLTALRQILCAFNKSDIERFPPSSYKEAALLIGKLDRCNAETMSAFATLAVDIRAFGPVSDWTDATIKIVGKVAKFFSLTVDPNVPSHSV